MLTPNLDISNEQRRSAAHSLGVVICAYTDERIVELFEAIDSLHAQTRAIDEVVVVIDHNDQLLAVVAALYPEISVVANQHKQGLSGARNTGIETLDTDIVGFLDDDAAAAPDWAERIVAHYDDPSVIGAGGFVKANWAKGRPSWFPREFDWVVGCSYVGMPTEVANVRNVIGANMSLRRDVFEKVGAFSTEVGRVGKKPVGCEETELSIRALAATPGARIVYDPDAKVTHKVTTERSKFSYFRTRCYMEGISKAQVVKMAGAGDGLSSERSYSTKILPLGVLRGIADLFRGKPSGIRRAAAIIIGLFTTTAGFIRGRIAPLVVTAPDSANGGAIAATQVKDASVA